MSRRSALWLAVGALAVLLGAGLLVRSRRAATPDQPPVQPPLEPPVEPVVPPVRPLEPPDEPIEPPIRPVEPTPEPIEPPEPPLPTWARVGIVAAALLAFFAVSLIATKQV